jgi:acetyltransferase-like isoleucine patch superfamily enzyme
MRTLRWRWWRLVAAARLRRLGGRLVVEADGAPRLRGPLRLETGPRPVTLTLRIGRGVKIGSECVIDLADDADATIELGEGAFLQARVRLQPWGGAIRVGAHVQLRDGCELKSKGELRIGERAICGRNSTVHCHAAVTLGEHVGLAERVTVTDSDHANDGSGAWFMQQPVVADPVVLERNVFCATNVVVLRGTLIRCNAVVAAGAVVTGGEHPAGWLIGGTPAKALKPLAAAAHHDPTLPLR